MDKPSASGNGKAVVSSLPVVTEIKARPYQREMMGESLKRNIIVAMDTGSGKTHVAIMRMIHELERMPSHQIIWFLAPTVSLCEQQHQVIKSQISAVNTKLLSGADGVDRWTEKVLWDAVLLNIKIVVSTYQILLDALTHGFVEMNSLRLIIFDEAHNCVGKHPGSRIMKMFYHTRKAESKDIPHILGLTASPVMRSDPKSVENIEKTLDAICRTPKHHRSDLIQHVKRPQLIEVRFHGRSTGEEPPGSTQSVDSLGKAFENLDLNEDPEVVRLRKDDSEKAQRRLARTYLNHKTWCSSQMKGFYQTSLKVYEELGTSSADYYVSEVVRQFGNSNTNGGESWDYDWDVTASEKRHISKILAEVKTIYQPLDISSSTALSISDKVRKLIDVLLQEDSSFRGIVFVQERAVVSVLAHLLSIHPETRDRFQIGTMAGTANHFKRKREIADFMGFDLKNDTLTDFRMGKLNLVIATSVLEEGIDVPECNLVICFQKPANIKSFVQRRGRARKENSKLILLLEHEASDKKQSATEWHQLEQNMREIYENDMRILQEYRVIEDSENHDGRTFRVEKTGAVLDLDNAVSHLHHFCATLPANQYLDRRPEFICEDTGTGSKIIRARVILPLSVDVSVRFADSRNSWKSEKNAIKDVAFEAYVALYHKGLVNDNLLPLFKHGLDVGDLLTTRVETRASLVPVDAQINPWVDVARSWKAGAQVNFASLALSTAGSDMLQIQLCSPASLLSVDEFKLYWDNATEFTVKVQDTTFNGDTQRAENETWSLLNAAFGHRFLIEKKQLPLLFSTMDATSLDQYTSSRTRIANHDLPLDRTTCGLISDVLVPNIKYAFKSYLPTKPPIDEIQHLYPEYEDAPEEPHISVTRLPKTHEVFRFLRKKGGEVSKKPHSSVIPASRCLVEAIPFHYIQLGLFIPSIMHQLSFSLVAQELSSTILAPVQIKDLSLVVTAISAPGASAAQNYERFEFLGDSLLKLCTSIQLMASYPLWPEGYLSGKKDRIVANSRLSRAAIELGLSKYIITAAASGHHWRPPYVEDLLASSNPNNPEEVKRELSTKVLADCVEALIGASMLDGGISSALKCMQVFLPELDWHPLQDRRQTIYDLVPEAALPTTLLPLQSLLGYEFTKPALLCEAVTHASFSTQNPTTPIHSLERLEFLGDAILDHLLVDSMYSSKLSHFDMHDLQSAMGNADFLAWCCMSLHHTSQTATLSLRLSPIYHPTTTPLYKFLRFSGLVFSTSMHSTSTRYTILHPAISAAIEKVERYPWTLLARLGAGKFFSDIIESLLGALWVDSGRMDVCMSFLEKVGILPYLRGILSTSRPDGRGGEKIGTMLLGPKTELGVLAGSERVGYRVFDRQKGAGECRAGEEEQTLEDGADGESRAPDEYVEEAETFQYSDGISGPFSCTVTVGSHPIATYHGALDRREAQFGAADLAILVLKKRKQNRNEQTTMDHQDRKISSKGDGEMDGDGDIEMCEDEEGNGNASPIEKSTSSTSGKRKRGDTVVEG